MKKIALILILSILLVACNTASDKGIKISGFVKNSTPQYIGLNYASRIRGNLNFDNFRSIASHIDSKGNFKFNSDNITDGAIYYLEFKNNAIPLTLFNGDNIQLEFEIDNLYNSLFAKGKGAGKINTLHLRQLAYENFDFENNKNLSEFTNHIEKVISDQINLVNSIFFKNEKDKVISQADNKIEIQKIITDSPLSKKEYDFLIKRVNFEKYSLITSFLSKITQQKSSDSLEINFNNKAFDNYNTQVYQKLDNINDWHLTNSLESILQIEYLRKLKEQDNIKVTYGNWQSFYSGSNYKNYYNWTAVFLKENFDNEIYSKYFAELSGYSMTLGYDYKFYYEKLDTLNHKNKYVARLIKFKNLMNNGLANKEYGLNQKQLTLDSKEFNKLLENHIGKPLLITFWSAQFAGASVVDNIPSIKDFEDENKEKVSIINICIDNEEYKKIWAARVIDNSWKSEHYFLPIEGNDSTLNKFSDKKISAFCYGGATYTYIDKNGTINNGIEFPFHKSLEEIERTIKQKPFANNGYK